MRVFIQPIRGVARATSQSMDLMPSSCIMKGRYGGRAQWSGLPKKVFSRAPGRCGVVLPTSRTVGFTPSFPSLRPFSAPSARIELSISSLHLASRGCLGPELEVGENVIAKGNGLPNQVALICVLIRQRPLARSAIRAVDRSAERPTLGKSAVAQLPLERWRGRCRRSSLVPGVHTTVDGLSCRRIAGHGITG